MNFLTKYYLIKDISFDTLKSKIVIELEVCFQFLLFSYKLETYFQLLLFFTNWKHTSNFCLFLTNWKHTSNFSFIELTKNHNKRDTEDFCLRYPLFNLNYIGSGSKTSSDRATPSALHTFSNHPQSTRIIREATQMLRS